MLNKNNNIVAASIFALVSILAPAQQASASPTGALYLHSSVAQILAAGVSPVSFGGLLAAAYQHANVSQGIAFNTLRDFSTKVSVSARTQKGVLADEVMTGAISGKKNALAQARRKAAGDVFNSVAIPFKKLGALRKAAETFREIKTGTALQCKSANCRELAKVSLVNADAPSIRAKLDSVNADINTRIQYRRDIDTHGRMDQWSSPSQTLARGTGDCEDYALLKMAVLADRGVPLEDMTVVILFDTKRKFYHAVLSVDVNGNHYILDNMRNQVLADSQLPNYMPLFSISNGRGFLHGTKIKGKALAMTSLDNIAPGEGGAL